jgi:hypothetical protein
MKPTVPEVLPLVWDLYDRSLDGCCLHIVLDDGNVDDASVKFCMRYAEEMVHWECLCLAETLLHMSKTQRTQLSSRAYERQHLRYHGGA